MKPRAPDDGYVRPVGGAHPVAGFLVTVLVIAVILVVAAAFAVRTRGGSELISDYLRDRTGLNVAVGKARLALPYDLVLEELRTRGGGSTNGDLSVREVRLQWQIDGSPVVKIRGADLALVKSGPDDWLPEAFSDVGGLSDVLQTPWFFREMPRLTLDVRDSSVRWTAGTNIWSVEGLGLRSLPLRVGGQAWRYFEVQAGQVNRAGGSIGRAVRRVWISAPENGYLEVAYRGLWNETVPDGRDWWSSPSVKAATGVP
jgi:hypothetical protein